MNEKFAHVLMLGGTGMLRSATLSLMSRAARMTSVSRTASSLEALHAAAPGGVAHVKVTADWNDPAAFLKAVSSALKGVTPPDLAVAWVHRSSLAHEVASLLATSTSDCQFFHVVGSARRDPLGIAAYWAQRAPVGIRYHQVVLGSVAQGDQRRWLTDVEISDGVLTAIDSGEPLTVVGTADAWPGTH